MKRAILILAISLACQGLGGDEVVWASGGRRVLLKDNGTWRVLKGASLAEWPDEGVTVQAAKVDSEDEGVPGVMGPTVRLRGVLVSQRPLSVLWIDATALDGDGFPLFPIYIRENYVAAGSPHFFVETSLMSAVKSMDVIKSWHYLLEGLTYADE